MTKIAFIIGFQYDDNESEKMGRSYLPGALVDIYRIYKTVCNNFDKVVVVSDVEVSNQDMYNLMSKDLVDGDIYTFKQEIIKYQTKNQVMDILSKTLNANFGLVYYTGHSLGTKLLLPGPDFISETDIYQVMSRITSPDIETLMIFDCCHGHNFLLPYAYDGRVFRLVDGIKLYFPHKVLSICASQYSQVSYSDIEGSPLTKSLYQHLTNKPTIRLHELFHKLTLDIDSSTGTQPKIYASYPDTHYLWPWVVTPTSWRVNFDVYNGSLNIVV
jgi:hypothetical protein